MTAFEKTMHVAEKFYSKDGYNYTARMLNGGGFMAQIKTKDRDYNVITRIEESTKLLIMEIYPGIHCSKEYIPMLSEYITIVNEKHKFSNIRMQCNGVLYVHSEAHFGKNNISGISEEVFKDMECTCLTVLTVFGKVLDKLAHGRLLTAKEADIDAVIEEHTNNSLKEMLSEIEDADLSEDDNADKEKASSDDDIASFKSSLFDVIEAIEKEHTDDSSTANKHSSKTEKSFFERLFEIESDLFADDSDKNIEEEEDGLEDILECTEEDE